MTVYCSDCGKELWDKHAGNKRALVICEALDNLDGSEGYHSLYDWFCVPCFNRQPLMVKARKDYDSRDKDDIFPLAN